MSASELPGGLFRAVEQNEETLVRQFIDAGGLCHGTDRHGKNILMVAAGTGKHSILSMLLEVLPVDYKGEDQSTALMCCRDAQSARILLEAGANPNAFNRFGNTAVIRSIIEERELELLRILVDGGANPAWANNDGNTALIVAAGRNRPDMLEVMLSSKEAFSLEGKDRSSGQTALAHAFSIQSMEVARMLVANGARTDVCDGRGNTLLMRALWESNIEMAHYALDLGVDAHQASTSRDTPLMVAGAMDMIDIVQRLLDLGADPDIVDTTGLRAGEVGTPRCQGLIQAHCQSKELGNAPQARRSSAARRI